MSRISLQKLLKTRTLKNSSVNLVK